MSTIPIRDLPTNEKQRVRERLTLFYTNHAPANMAAVDKAMTMSLTEEVIFEKLHQKYGVSPADEERAARAKGVFPGGVTPAASGAAATSRLKGAPTVDDSSEANLVKMYNFECTGGGASDSSSPAQSTTAQAAATTGMDKSQVYSTLVQYFPTLSAAAVHSRARECASIPNSGGLVSLGEFVKTAFALHGKILPEESVALYRALESSSASSKDNNSNNGHASAAATAPASPATAAKAASAARSMYPPNKLITRTPAPWPDRPLCAPFRNLFSHDTTNAVAIVHVFSKPSREGKEMAFDDLDSDDATQRTKVTELEEVFSGAIATARKQFSEPRRPAEAQQPRTDGELATLHDLGEAGKLWRDCVGISEKRALEERLKEELGGRNNSSGTSALAATATSYRDRLIAIFTVHDPPKLAFVDATLTKFAGKEDALIKALHAKYQIDDSSSSNSNSSSSSSSSTTSIIEKYEGGWSEVIPQARILRLIRYNTSPPVWDHMIVNHHLPELIRSHLSEDTDKHLKFLTRLYGPEPKQSDFCVPVREAADAAAQQTNTSSSNNRSSGSNNSGINRRNGSMKLLRELLSGADFPMIEPFLDQLFGKHAEFSDQPHLLFDASSDAVRMACSYNPNQPISANALQALLERVAVLRSEGWNNLLMLISTDENVDESQQQQIQRAVATLLLLFPAPGMTEVGSIVEAQQLLDAKLENAEDHSSNRESTTASATTVGTHIAVALATSLQIRTVRSVGVFARLIEGVYLCGGPRIRNRGGVQAMVTQTTTNSTATEQTQQQQLALFDPRQMLMHVVHTRLFSQAGSPTRQACRNAMFLVTRCLRTILFSAHRREQDFNARDSSHHSASPLDNSRWLILRFASPEFVSWLATLCSPIVAVSGTPTIQNFLAVIEAVALGVARSAFATVQMRDALMAISAGIDFDAAVDESGGNEQEQQTRTNYAVARKWTQVYVMLAHCMRREGQIHQQWSKGAVKALAQRVVRAAQRANKACDSDDFLAVMSELHGMGASLDEL